MRHFCIHCGHKGEADEFDPKRSGPRNVWVCKTCGDFFDSLRGKPGYRIKPLRIPSPRKST